MKEADASTLPLGPLVEKSGPEAAPYDSGVSVSMEANEHAPGLARMLLAQFAAEFPDDVIQRASLATSELITNAVRHGSNDGTELELRLWRSADLLVVEVIDTGKATPAEGDLQGGFGLGIVSTVSERFRSVRADAWHVTAEFSPR
ncbi:MAG: ATP-binding protein [Acidimicrobiia bacterium]|nr:ATP-binding protein [Acidimicrobiia bacterium]